MIEAFLVAFNTVKDAFAYRYRGGGWQGKEHPETALDSTTTSRIAWGFSQAITVYSFTFNPLYALLAVVLGWATQVCIEHSPYQGMGRMPMASNRARQPHNWLLTMIAPLFGTALFWKWPEDVDNELEHKPAVEDGDPIHKFDPISTKGLWICLLGMASVGAVRGVVFASLAGFAYLGGLAINAAFPLILPAIPAPLWGLMWLPLMGAVFQPLAYAIGYRIPCKFDGLNYYGPEWGEFLSGAGWGISVSVCLLLC